MITRIGRLRGLMKEAGVEGLYITSPENRFYLSGFSGTDGALLVCMERLYLITDFRYTGQAFKECPEFEIIEVKDSYLDSLAKAVTENGITLLGFEGDHLAYNQYTDMKYKLAGVELKHAGGLVEDLRLCKDDVEVKYIAEAARLADEAFEQVLPDIRPGISEREIALQLEYIMRRKGADGAAFNFIVASGPRSALPHGVASSRVLREGDLVVLDFGAIYRGYHSDITRTVVIGRTSRLQEDIYYIVLEAQMSAVSALRAGVRASDVDRAARGVIERRGYGEYFGHSTGHGLGLKIHEKPRLSSKDDTVLQAGMVVTVEPGIYLPDWGGVRIEDTVLVENDCSRVLTKTPKRELIVLS